MIVFYENEHSIKTKFFSIDEGNFLTMFKMKNNNFLISNVNGDVFELKYNNKTFEIIANKKKMHLDFVSCFAELNNGILISASDDNTIKLFV